MALLLGIALLPMGALTLNAGLNAARLNEVAGQQRLAEQVRLEIVERQKEVMRLRTMALTLASNTQLIRDGAARCSAALAELVREFRETATVAVLDGDARIVCASDPAAVGSNTSAQSLIATAAARGDVAVGYVGRPLLTSGPSIGVVTPMQRAPGSSPLYVGATRLVGPLLERRSTDRSIFAVLADAQGRMLASATNGLSAGQQRALQQTLARGALNSDDPFRAGDLWAVSMPIADSNLFLVQGWRGAANGIDSVLGTAWALMAPLLIWFVAIAATWVAVEVYIVRPLTTLEAAARSYARGEPGPDTHVVDNAPSEIRSLRRTLAAMAKTLRGREQRLTEALHEERALLRELSHRVNNNLQLVASLLSIQSRAAPNNEQSIGFERAHERVQMLALAQNRIYASGHVREDVPLDEMVAEIARSMTRSRGARAENVELQLALAPTKASIDHAVPLAFLVGESISHALDLLQEGPRAALVVSLQPGDGEVLFSVESPGGGKRKRAASPAKRIVEAFAAQIGAEAAYDAADPLTIRLRLKTRDEGVSGEDAA